LGLSAESAKSVKICVPFSSHIFTHLVYKKPFRTGLTHEKRVKAVK